MKVAVLNPYFLFRDQTRNFNGYNFEFVRQYKPVLYFQTGLGRANPLRKIHEYRVRHKVRVACQSLGLPSDQFDVVFHPDDLNGCVDVLACFNGRPDIPAQAPPASFKGMTAFHVMDYVFRAMASFKALKTGGVDFVLGYADHGRHCRFFRAYYPDFVDRVIPVPFGFGERFENRKPFADRVRKVIALGSVNPVDDPTVKDKTLLEEYRDFYSGVQWTHQWRRTLSENEARLGVVMDSMLPSYPKTKDFSYDAVDLLNRYAMFANDEGLMAFPPARTYEGVASGAILVCSNHPCYTDLGFADGVNCLTHRPLDVDDFERKVLALLAQPERMAEIAAAGTAKVRTQFNHPQVARTLYGQILQKWRRG